MIHQQEIICMNGFKKIVDNGNMFKSIPCIVHNNTNCLICDEELKEEKESFLNNCGSCLKFVPFMESAGFCDIAECNCLCKNPKVIIDMFDDKCDNWAIN